ncbi:polysaccharide deacetylase family protein, partial [Candidatus Bathyarchaeota archaeon]|nr:polysaccharide deacetylase family protein [Candidatus Bathyarchaeota archaeon]
EIGCHGLAHTADENYRRMDPSTIEIAIGEATQRIRAVAGRAPTCFRGPYMTTSVETQQTLIENGYVADFSVCSQRVDICNSRGGTIGWLTATL